MGYTPCGPHRVCNAPIPHSMGCSCTDLQVRLWDVQPSVCTQSENLQIINFSLTQRDAVGYAHKRDHRTDHMHPTLDGADSCTDLQVRLRDVQTIWESENPPLLSSDYSIFSWPLGCRKCTANEVALCSLHISSLKTTSIFNFLLAIGLGKNINGRGDIQISCLLEENEILLDISSLIFSFFVFF